jgi:hypothetical protein
MKIDLPSQYITYLDLHAVPGKLIHVINRNTLRRYKYRNFVSCHHVKWMLIFCSYFVVWNDEMLFAVVTYSIIIQKYNLCKQA